MRNEIIRVLQKVTDNEEINLSSPENPEHGDYSSNVALQMAKGLGKTPREVAEDLKKELEENPELSKIVERIEVAGPGFINFFISKDALFDNLIQLSKGNSISLDFLKGKKIVFEYGQPNTHKMPHIGHLYSYIYGESTSRILEAAGAEVIRANYQGDIGLHVAKCLWAYKKNSPSIPQTLSEKVQLLQKLYQEGSKAYEESEEAKSEITKINKSLYDQNPELMELWEETRSWSIEYYKEFEKRLGVAYNRSYFESEVYRKGIDIVNGNPDVFVKSQGALIFEGKKLGLHDRVFLTSYGTPTYEAKDLALAMQKIDDWSPELLVITTASEQNDYFKVIFKALETLHPEYKGKLKHIGFGMVQLREGKLSSRTGEIIGAIDLVSTINNRIEEILQTREGMTKEEKEKIAETVGIGAVKYSFLKTNPQENIKFDLEESISQEGNSGPYLQYTFVRAQSVLEKSAKTLPTDVDTGSISDLEIQILRRLSQFNDTIEDAAKMYSPNVLCLYLYELAREFNAFYNKEKIIGSENESLRLMITSGVSHVLKTGLSLLGIETPEKM